MKAHLISFVCLLSLALSSCSPSLQPADASPDLHPLDPQAVPAEGSTVTPIPVLPTQGDATQMIPATANLDNLIAKAMEDLAQQLSIPTDQISIVEATQVTWSDASLGCPQKGMAYAEVLTPGYLIRLEYGGNIFEYHTSTGNTIVTCKNPSPPVPGTPGIY